jgi:multisubunit Na+/H+ antiporter MnhB subunit
MVGYFAILFAVLAFLVPMAVFFSWLNWDIQRAATEGANPENANMFGPFLGGLMLFGFAGGAIAKLVMLISRRPDPNQPSN